MGIIRSPPNFATVLFPYTHNFLPSAEKIAQSKGNLARPTAQTFTFTALRPPQFAVSRDHNIWVVTESVFMASGHHSSLWPKATTFEKSHRGYSWPKITPVRCSQRPSHSSKFLYGTSQMLWPLATMNWSDLWPWIASMWLLKCCGFWLQQTGATFDHE